MAAASKEGVLTIETSRIHHNPGIGFRGEIFRGAVRNQSGGRVMLDRTWVDHNWGALGSGIRNDGSAVLRDSLVGANHGAYRLGPWGDPPARGGAGGVYNTGVFTITNSSLIANTAVFTDHAKRRSAQERALVAGQQMAFGCVPVSITAW